MMRRGFDGVRTVSGESDDYLSDEFSLNCEGSAGPWHFEAIFVDFETLDFRIERSRRQPKSHGGPDGPQPCSACALFAYVRSLS